MNLQEWIAEQRREADRSRLGRYAGADAAQRQMLVYLEDIAEAVGAIASKLDAIGPVVHEVRVPVYVSVPASGVPVATDPGPMPEPEKGRRSRLRFWRRG